MPPACLRRSFDSAARGGAKRALSPFPLPHPHTLTPHCRPNALPPPTPYARPPARLLTQVQPDLATDAECRACYRGLPLLTSAGPCTVQSVQGGSIR